MEKITVTMDDVSVAQKIEWLRELKSMLEASGYIPTIDEAIVELQEYEKLHKDDEEPLRDPSEDESDDNKEVIN